MKTPRMYYGALAVFCVVALCIGFATAAGTTQSAHTSAHGKGMMHQTFDLTNTTLQQQILTRYQNQGTDTTGLAAAFQSGNVTDIKAWMAAHRPGVPASAQRFGKTPDYTNATVQQQILARYQNRGTDTTGLAAAFQSGNVTDVKTWMAAHRPEMPGFSNRSAGKVPDYTNATVQQQILARYQNQGTDTTGLAAAFQSGNVTDVKSWMAAHRPAVPASAKGFGKTPDYTNATVQQQILTRFSNQGVDTSALRAAFQNGDTAAVKSWFEAYFASHRNATGTRTRSAGTTS